MGDGTAGEWETFARFAPVTVLAGNAPLDGVRALAAGYEHTCAVKFDGTALCWGSNEFGQLGPGADELCQDQPCRLTATVVMDGDAPLAGVRAMVAGYGHTCALLETGSVRCWGRNDAGQLGDGTMEPRAGPVAVAGLPATVIALAAGGGHEGGHTCALTTTEEVWCWGDNRDGQLGDGSTTGSSTPVRVQIAASGEPLLNAWGIAAGSYAESGHSCALVGDGSVYCWGYNESGELGNGQGGFIGARSLEPVRVETESLERFVALTSGYRHSCTVTHSGELFCWGANSDGQIGDGTQENKLIAHPVIGLPGTVTALATGEMHTCARVEDGRVFCWGSNLSGQLGNPAEVAESFVPIEVAEP